MQQVIFIRGASGSGKTTLARQLIFTLSKDAVILETDDYFVKQGQYQFERDKLQSAHDWNRQRFTQALHEGGDIIVSNTFIKLWELNKYLEHIDTSTIRVTIYELHSQYGGVHDVPQEVVDRTRKHFEPYTGTDVLVMTSNQPKSRP